MESRSVILVLTGEISSGKSSLAKGLSEKFLFQHFKTKEVLLKLFQRNNRTDDGRAALQMYGEKLDEETRGRWIVKEFQNIYNSSDSKYFVVDSCRILDQIKEFRRAYGYSVYHIHLIASDDTLKTRFLNRGEVSSKDNALEKYNEFKNNKTEKNVKKLAEKADLVIDTERSRKGDVFIRVVSFLKLQGSRDIKNVDVVVGGQFGSEGKGQVAAYLSQYYDGLIRVGGPNAGHSVFEKPKSHIFHCLPSGTYRNPKAMVIIGPGAVLNAQTVLDEVNKFNIDSNRIVIDENATIITKDDIQKEIKSINKISSTKQGVGAATSNNIYKRFIGEDDHKAKNCRDLKGYVGSSYEAIQKLLRDGKKILLEGTQGTMLSLYHGFYPKVTSRDTTVSGCLSESGIAPRLLRKVILVVRTYPIRVAGDSGPFQSDELSWKIISKRSGIPLKELKEMEKTSTTKRERRVAEFSWQLFRKACELNSPTDIALTFLDYFTRNNKDAKRYDQLSKESRQMIEELEVCSGVKVSLLGTGFDYRAIIDRRNWI